MRRNLSSQRDILLLIPLEGLEKILRLKVGPEPLHHKEIRIDRLDRQETGQASHPAPADYQIDAGDVVGAEFAPNLQSSTQEFDRQQPNYF